MRKTLVVLAVVISILLLQSPAWAPNLYLEQVDPTDTDSNRAVKVSSDTCKRANLKVTFTWGTMISGTTALTNGKYQYQTNVTNVPLNHPPITKADAKSATCAGRMLALTGAASTRLLALGLSLLVIGTLLVLWGRRRPLIWRG
jgi:hypothetical protein